MKPVVGINCNYEVKEGARPRHFLDRDYCTAVELHGGVPVLLPTSTEEGSVGAFLGILNGLILSGSKDLNPSRYGQDAHPSTVPVVAEKEEFDIRLVRSALKMDMPVLGICYGEQLLNVSLGGSLFQDIPSHPGTSAEHHNPSGGRHKVFIERGTKLHRVLGVEAIETNSTHHQAVDRLGDGLKVCARAEDGVIEAIESKKHTFVLAVQWHPERMLDEPTEKLLFSGFMKEVRHYASQKT